MGIMLGNLSPEEIERRLRIKFSDEDMAFLKENRQEQINGRFLEPHAWHCYDIPFMIMTATLSDASAMYDRLIKYDIKGTVQIGYERKNWEERSAV